MAQRVTGQRFRQRKLSTKQNLPVLREYEIEQTLDDDAQRNIPKVETGVEKGEEIEHHLQAVISAQASAVGGRISQLYIPTPETIASSLQYEQLYPPRFQQPVSYIRFSSTVEDCVGCPYCMTAEDEVFLKSINAKRSTQCSEDQFEQVMYFFEETAQTKQPFAAVDNPPVLSYEEMESAFDESIDESCKEFARDIYEHWKAERLKRENRGLMPSLKFERNVETDDNDPYVCFRRREVRQTRKTRGRDAQVTEKLQSLRRQLELARQLMHAVKQRENARMEQLQLDRTIFEQRAKLKEVKRNLNIKGDDEDLINQKPAPKPRPKLDSMAAQRGMPGAGPKQSLARADSGKADSDLVLLDDINAKKKEEVERYVEDNKAKHQNWNKGWVDATWRPITPPLESNPKPTFRTAIADFLPTPPASVASGDSGDNSYADSDTHMADDAAVTVRYVSPPPDQFTHSRPSYRRRIGRGGRLMIDRRGLKRPWAEDDDERVSDRYTYDQDSDEDDEIYLYNPFDNDHIKYRIHLGSPSNREAAAAAAAQQAAQARKSVSGDATAASGRPPPALARAASSAHSAAQS